MLITATEFIMHSHFTGRIASNVILILYSCIELLLKFTSFIKTLQCMTRNENGFNRLTLYRSILISIMSML